MKKGQIIELADVTLKRVNVGLSADFLDIIIGKRLIKGIREDEGFTWSHFMEE